MGYPGYSIAPQLGHFVEPAGAMAPQAEHFMLTLVPIGEDVGAAIGDAVIMEGPPILGGPHGAFPKYALTLGRVT